MHIVSPKLLPIGALTALALTMALTANASANDVWFDVYGNGHTVDVEQRQQGNSAAITVGGNQVDLSVLQMGTGSELSVTAFGNRQSNYVVAPLCPNGLTANPVLLTDSNGIEVAIPRCS